MTYVIIQTPIGSSGAIFLSFSNVKTLRVGDGLVEKLSRCLHLEDGEDPLELLPELGTLTCFESHIAGDSGAFTTSFIDARQKAGRPVTLVRHNQSAQVWGHTG